MLVIKTVCHQNRKKNVHIDHNVREYVLCEM